MRPTPAPTSFALAVATALIAGAFSTHVNGSTGPIPLKCDRACLERVIDQYSVSYTHLTLPTN